MVHAIFGAVHLSNALGHGAQAVPQALVVSFAGYFFYLMRRVSGGNALNSVLHGLFDFSLLTGTVVLVDQDPYLGSLAAILAYVAAAAVVLVRRTARSARRQVRRRVSPERPHRGSVVARERPAHRHAESWPRPAAPAT